MEDRLREQLADYAHETWAGWMRYLFRFGVQRANGSFTISADKVERWRRQMELEYSELPEGEKESDRKEADRIIAIIAAERM